MFSRLFLQEVPPELHDMAQRFRAKKERDGAEGFGRGRGRGGGRGGGRRDKIDSFFLSSV